MSNPKFIGVDLSVPTFTWSAGVNSSYPVSNLKNYFPDSKSRSNGTGVPQYLTLDMGSAVECSALVGDGHNIASLSVDTISLEADDNSGFTSPEEIVAEISVASATTPMLETFTPATYRYWRLKYDAASPLLAAPELGNLFLGTSFDFGKTMDWDFIPGVPDFVTSKSTALDGRVRSAQSFGGYKRWSMKFTLFSDTVRANWLTFLSTVRGDGRPFYYVDENGNIYLVIFEQSFGEVRSKRYNLNDTVQLGFRTVLANY